ncbi:MAG: DEAD/DEAH box helicase [Pyrinomonadaceae bacterium]
MPSLHRPLRRWQELALQEWVNNGKRGIVSVVTGGGKTFFALNCINEFQRKTAAATVLITVPTTALVDQWLEELISFFDMPPKFVNLLTGKGRVKRGRINIGVINTAAKLTSLANTPEVFLVVDECHKAASPAFREIFNIEKRASLGLSATPERPYDNWFEEILVPELGPVIYEYSYAEALQDGVIVPFRLNNVLFEFTDDEQREYDEITKKISKAVSQHGTESDQAIRLLLKRARFSNSSPTRVRIALKIIARHRDKKILVFHEDIHAAEFLFEVLRQNEVPVGIYHSKIPLSRRVSTLHDYRAGRISVLVSCRALDEGFNVPESEIGIIAASTATYRQRIQRLGRVLRPAPDKERAIIYSIVASIPEIRRLAAEAEDLKEIAEIEWSRA